MSEALTAETETDLPADEATFEAARVADLADGDPPEEQEGDKPEEQTVDWKKRATDKEGQAASERVKRRAAERESRELKERLERLEAAASKPKAADDDDLLSLIRSIPTGDDDPIGKLEVIEKALRVFADQQTKEAEADTQTTARQREFTKLASVMADAEADFAADHPDYADAVKHFREAREAEFEDMGYAGEALKRAIAEDFVGLARRSIEGGRDPAEVVYNLAKKRGFQSGEKAAKEKLKEISAAAEAKTPSGGGGRGDGVLTADGINKLKGAAYDSAWAKMRDRERRAG